MVDTGEDASDPFVRLYRTASNIRYHCDAADVVALLCLNTAKRGGASRIVSSVSVFNELAKRRPDLVARLFEPFHLDIRDEDGVLAAVDQMVGRHGQIHGLVNNAGGQFPAALEDISIRGWEAVVRNNLTGGFLMSREVFKQSMKQAGEGAIVNITADHWRGMPDMGHSGAARGGMENFTMTAAAEWGRYGVRVNSVAPGWVASSGFDTYDEEYKAILRSLPAQIPLGRLGRESEVAGAVTFLLSPAAAFVSGSCIRVDGAAPNYPRNHTLPEGRGNAPFDGFHREHLPRALTEDD